MNYKHLIAYLGQKQNQDYKKSLGDRFITKDVVVPGEYPGKYYWNKDYFGDRMVPEDKPNEPIIPGNGVPGDINCRWAKAGVYRDQKFIEFVTTGWGGCAGGIAGIEKSNGKIIYDKKTDTAITFTYNMEIGDVSFERIAEIMDIKNPELKRMYAV